MRREVLTLVVHCSFMEDGCAWKGEVRHLEVLNRPAFHGLFSAFNMDQLVKIRRNR